MLLGQPWPVQETGILRGSVGITMSWTVIGLIVTAVLVALAGYLRVVGEGMQRGTRHAPRWLVWIHGRLTDRRS
jgi:hypothetical protein